MNLAAAVILYYPDENVVQNILSYSAFADRIYIFDNSETRSEIIKSRIENIPHASYFHDGSNEGIAVRLNQAASSSIKEGFDWLLTMDQDSSFLQKNILQYLQCVQNYSEKEKVAMFGINYAQPENENKECAAKQTEHLITSGSLLNLHIYKSTNGFDENLFIDEVDLEYCYRSILKGYKIIRFENIFLHHELGKINYRRSLKNFALSPRTIHSPLRVYYMVRNHLYLSKKYKQHFKEDIKRSKNAIMLRIKNNLLYGKNKIKLLSLVVKAYRDFKKNKMGKIK